MEQSSNPDSVHKLSTASASNDSAAFHDFLSGGVRTKYQVLVFDYSCDALTPFEFGDRIQSRLSVSLSSIADLGCPYRVEFLTLGTALIAFISYQVAQPLPVVKQDNV